MKAQRSDKDGKYSAIVPLDHESVIEARGPDYKYEALAKRLERDRTIFQVHAHNLHAIRTEEFVRSIATSKTDEQSPHWDNAFFTAADALSLMSMLVMFQPRRYVEIGSGNSTKFARHTIRHKNLPTKITSIDPYPRADIDLISDHVVRESVLRVGTEIFEQLEADDILFHDGSHITFNGTDTVPLFLEILPVVRPGVIVHIHDMCLPFEYQKTFSDRGYSEQYMLAAMLLFSPDWEVLLPNYYLWKQGELSPGGVSFWIRRVR